MNTAEAPAGALFIGPHPDDVDLFCGGTVARLAALGHRVVIADLSGGELATRGTPELRGAEAQVAAERLGAAERLCLGLPDGHLDGASEGQVDAIVALLRTVRPALVFAPAAIDRHPDHEAAHRLVRRAAFLAALARHAPASAPHRVATLLFYPLHTHLRADLCVDTSEVFATKQHALDAFASQLAPTSEAGATVLTAPNYRGALEARDRSCGALIGVATAEPYLADVPARVDDPMEALQLFGTPTAWRQEPRR